MSTLRPRASTVGVGLVMASVVLLVASDEIRFGSPPSEVGGPYEGLALLAGLAAVGVAMAAKPARIPVGLSVLLVTGLVALGELTGALAFYDAAGLGLVLGSACIVALWLILAGRRVQPPWSRDLPRRALSYLCVGVGVLPFSLFAGLEVGCTASDGEDDLCGMGWLLIGLPITVLIWLLAVAAAEVAAAVRRRSSLSSPGPC